MKLTCEYCGKEFERVLCKSRQRKHYFCSKECSSKWHKTRTKIVCDYCGKEFERVPSLIKEHNFCSRECATNWIKETGAFKKEKNPRWNSVQVECDNCGKDIWVSQYFVEHQEHHFCSRECFSAFLRKVRQGSNHPSWKGGNIKTSCAICEKELSVIPAVYKEGRNFCSKECANIFHSKETAGENNPNWKGGGVTKVCPVCGKTFTTSHSERESAKYCSNKCWITVLKRIYRGENHHNWQGGKSFEPYCVKFNEELRENVREKYGRRCFLCSKTEEQNGRRLSVHHIDYDKKAGCNSKKWLLVPLCISCHTKTNFNRDYWESIIRAKMRKRNLSHTQTILDVFF